MKDFKRFEGSIRLLISKDVNTISFRGHTLVDEDYNSIAVCEDLDNAKLMEKSKEMYNKLIECYEYFSEQQTRIFGDFTESIEEILDI